jgi:glutaminase
MSRTEGREDPVTALLEAVRRQVEPDRSGTVAGYIPQLAQAPPDRLGLAAATVDGALYGAGDDTLTFTIQSISKPLVYGLALEDRGVEEVMARVGVEPTGEAFNSIRLTPERGTPFNPMVNAGAIATTGLVRGDTPAERLERVRQMLGRYVGHEVEVDGAVRDGERETGHRNRAIAHLLRNSGVIEGDPEAVLDVYFAQCAALVTCRDLAVIGATLANRGVNPLTGVRALAEPLVGTVLSVMTMCGMYDQAGRWVVEVGLPAKSGVAGGVLAVLPGQLGIGTFSPRLDEHGNSVRGMLACRRISSGAELHLLDPPNAARETVRRRYRCSARRSRHRRDAPAMALLGRIGDRIRVYELQGELMFAGAEAVTGAVLADSDGASAVILDVRRLGPVNAAGARMMGLMAESLQEQDTPVIVAPEGTHPGLADALAVRGVAWPTGFPSVDEALKWCEDRLLAGAGALVPVEDEVPLGRSELGEGLTPGETRRLEAVVDRLDLAAGDVLYRAGDPPDALFGVAAGEVALVAGVEAEKRVRIAAATPGTLLGEASFVDGRPYGTDAVAVTPVRVWRLTRAALEEIPDEEGRLIRTRVLLNIARSLADRLRQAAQEIGALS